ncbi:hypothetical protein YWY31_36740 [Paenibacillus illinoisensis]
MVYLNFLIYVVGNINISLIYVAGNILFGFFIYIRIQTYLVGLTGYQNFQTEGHSHTITEKTEMF